MKNLLAVLILAAFSAWGQSVPTTKDTIWVGADLQLGLPKQAVMSRLGENYKLFRLAGPDSCDCWIVQSKSTPAVTYGEIMFDKGKLDFASKVWTNGEEDSFAFARALHGALEEFSKEGRRVCSFHTTTSHTPTMEQEGVTLSCGAKRLVVQATEIFSGENRGKLADIQEILTTESESVLSLPSR